MSDRQEHTSLGDTLHSAAVARGFDECRPLLREITTIIFLFVSSPMFLFLFCFIFLPRYHNNKETFVFPVLCISDGGTLLLHGFLLAVLLIVQQGA